MKKSILFLTVSLFLFNCKQQRDMELIFSNDIDKYGIDTTGCGFNDMWFRKMKIIQIVNTHSDTMLLEKYSTSCNAEYHNGTFGGYNFEGPNTLVHAGRAPAERWLFKLDSIPPGKSRCYLTYLEDNFHKYDCIQYYYQYSLSNDEILIEGEIYPRIMESKILVCFDKKSKELKQYDFSIPDDAHKFKIPGK